MTVKSLITINIVGQWREFLTTEGWDDSEKPLSQKFHMVITLLYFIGCKASNAIV